MSSPTVREQRDERAAASIVNRLGSAARSLLSGLVVLEETDSTNSWLGRMPPGHRHGFAVLARRQARGRGRRDREWHSPAGGNVYLSLGWGFGTGPAEPSTVPLLVAVCLARSLEGLGLDRHGVKWPNDILADGRKLAGVLVESQTAAGGRFQAVIGIGLNVRMPETTVIDRPWTDLEQELGAGAMDGLNTETVAGAILDELLPGLARFEAEGFAAYREEWARFDLLAGRTVRIEAGGHLRQGVARGIDRHGSLLLEPPDGRSHAIHHGEASILRD